MCGKGTKPKNGFFGSPQRGGVLGCILFGGGPGGPTKPRGFVWEVGGCFGVWFFLLSQRGGGGPLWFLHFFTQPTQWLGLGGEIKKMPNHFKQKMGCVGCLGGGGGGFVGFWFPQNKPNPPPQKNLKNKKTKICFCGGKHPPKRGPPATWKFTTRSNVGGFLGLGF